MKRFNKATAAALAGALVTAAAALWPLEGGLQGALQTVLTAALVWLVPNVGAEDAGPRP